MKALFGDFLAEPISFLRVLDAACSPDGWCRNLIRIEMGGKSKGNRFLPLWAWPESRLEKTWSGGKASRQRL